MEQGQVERGNADGIENLLAPEEQQDHRQALHLEDLVDAVAGNDDHAIAEIIDAVQGVAFPDGVVEAVIGLGEVGFHAHQEHRHTRNDGQVGQEDRQVIDHRGPEAGDDGLGGVRVEPEDELVGPDCGIEQQAGKDQGREDLVSASKIESQQAVAWILADDGVEETEEQQAMAQQQASQQAFQTVAGQGDGADHGGTVAQHEHHHDAAIGLHAGEEDGHRPEIAQHHEIGQHQQPVEHRGALEEQHHGQQAQSQRQQGADPDDPHQVGQDQLVALGVEAIRHPSGEHMLEQAGKRQRHRHQVSDRHQELNHLGGGHRQGETENADQHHPQHR